MVDARTNETVVICYVSFISSYTYGDYVPQLDAHIDMASILLALEHLNHGVGTIVPEVEGINKRCPIRFTFETADDQGKVAICCSPYWTEEKRS